MAVTIAYPNTTFFETDTEFTGNDLVQFKGAPLKGISVRKAVGNNQTRWIETVNFASIQAPNQTDGNKKEFNVDIDETGSEKLVDIEHRLGSPIETDNDYFSKLFFGTGDGMFKSPTHSIRQPTDISLATLDNTRYAVRHGFVSSPYNLAANFTLSTDEGFASNYVYNKSVNLKGWWRFSTDYSGIDAPTRASNNTLALTSGGTASSWSQRQIIIGSGDGNYDGSGTYANPNWANGELAVGNLVRITHPVTLDTGDGPSAVIDLQDTYKVESIDDSGNNKVVLTRVSPPNEAGRCATYSAVLNATVKDNISFVVNDGSNNTTITLDSANSAPAAADNAISIRFRDLVSVADSDVEDNLSRKIIRDRIIKAVNGIADSNIIYANASTRGVAGEGIKNVYACLLYTSPSPRD